MNDPLPYQTKEGHKCVTCGSVGDFDQRDATDAELTPFRALKLWPKIERVFITTCRCCGTSNAVIQCKKEAP